MFTSSITFSLFLDQFSKDGKEVDDSEIGFTIPESK